MPSERRSASGVFERCIRTDNAPEGMCWSYRELHSYQTELVLFCDRLLEMGAGLEQPYVSLTLSETNDDCILYVVGLRPMGPEDRAEAMLRAERKRADDLATLAELKAQYEPDPGGDHADH